MKAVFPAVCILLACRIACGQEAAPTSDSELLASESIEATTAGVKEFLRGLKPDTELQQKAKALIAQLGDDDFAAREAAAGDILALPRVPLALLHEAASSNDKEVAFRARNLLGHPQLLDKLAAEQRRGQVVAAVLRTIRDRQINRTTGVLIEIAPYLDSWELVQSAGDAAAVVAEPADAELLQLAIAGDNVAARLVAIRGLGKSAGDSARERLREQADDQEPRIALAAAHALADTSDRTALEKLVKLLSSKDEPVRARSVQILRAWTQQNFKFNPYIADPVEQATEIARWQSWLAGEGRTAKLHLPLKLEPLPEDLTHGLLVHFTFDGDAGARISDSSAHARHGTIHNRVAFVARNGGKALQLFGTGHHGDAGGHAILPFIPFSTLDEFTLAIWVRETGLTHEEGEAYVTYGIDRSVGIEDALGIAHFNGNLLFRAGDGQIQVPYDVADRGRWVHYALTYRDGRLAAFRDGRLIRKTRARISVDGERAAIGRHWWSGGAGTSTRLQAAVDDFRVYDRALSDEQISRLRGAAE